MLAYANHTIHHGNGLVQEPGSVFELDVDEKDFKLLVQREAIREPSEDEVKLHKLANGGYGAEKEPAGDKNPPSDKGAGEKSAGADKTAAGGKSTADDNIG